MRELDISEVEEVQGGVGIWGAIVGGAISACGAWAGGASGLGIATATLAGAGSGFFGGLIGKGGSVAADALFATKAVSLGIGATSVATDN